MTNTNPSRVPFPLLELIGPPCQKSDCSGVLVNTISMKTGICFRECSKCQSRFDEQSVTEILDKAIETIESAPSCKPEDGAK